MKRLIPLAVLATVATSLVLISSAPARSASGQSCPQSENGLGPTPSAQLGHPLNYAVLEECQGGAQQGIAQVQIQRAGGQDQPTNYAFAYSHDCSSPCETIAAAFQVVLQNQNSTAQSPQNAGLGVNENCNGCVAFGFADQYVVDVPPNTQLPQKTKRQIAAIGRQAQSDVNAALGFSDPQTALGNLDSQLKALATQEHQDVLAGLKQDNIHNPGHHDSQHSKTAPGPSAG